MLTETALHSDRLALRLPSVHLFSQLIDNILSAHAHPLLLVATKFVYALLRLYLLCIHHPLRVFSHAIGLRPRLGQLFLIRLHGLDIALLVFIQLRLLQPNLRL